MKQGKRIPVIILILPIATILLIVMAFNFNKTAPQEDLKSKYAYKDFESAKKCRSCHPGIYEQWSQAMMSQA